MTRLLLDTNIILLLLTRPESLESPCLEEISNSSDLLVSVLSYWEVVIKSRKGKLHIEDASVWWKDAVEALGARVLPFKQEHVRQVQFLPEIHSDPFDRGLVAQAIVEELKLVTTDGALREYACECLVSKVG